MSVPDSYEKKRMPRNIRKKYVNNKKCKRRKERQEIKKVMKYELIFLTEREYDLCEYSHGHNHVSISIK